MNRMLVLSLQAAAIGQACVALLNLNLVRIMKWRPEVAGFSLLVRQVFHIHTFFVSLTLLIFSAFTWRFAHVLAGGQDSACRWMAGSMGVFWAIRAVLQVAYYSSSHWRGIPSRVAVHLLLLTV